MYSFTRVGPSLAPRDQDVAVNIGTTFIRIGEPLRLIVGKGIVIIAGPEISFKGILINPLFTSNQLIMARLDHFNMLSLH